MAEGELRDVDRSEESTSMGSENEGTVVGSRSASAGEVAGSSSLSLDESELSLLLSSDSCIADPAESDSNEADACAVLSIIPSATSSTWDSSTGSRVAAPSADASSWATGAVGISVSGAGVVGLVIEESG